MQYKGKLYGRIRNKYFDTGMTSEDWDNLENNEIELTTEVKLILWEIANLAIEVVEDSLNGEEFEELAFKELKKLKQCNTKQD